MLSKIYRKSILTLTLALVYAFFVSTGWAFPASDFSLKSLDGQTISSSSLRGKVVVLAFGASWLPLSKSHVLGIQKLADQYSGHGVEVFWVSTDSASPKSKNFATDDQVRTFAERNGLRVKVLRDPDGVVSKTLGVDQLPAVVVIDKQGNAVDAPVGGIDSNNNFADRVSMLLSKAF
ncbi:MAG: peroxiredoxin family protein [Pyrinomonadaceae bacterium]